MVRSGSWLAVLVPPGSATALRATMTNPAGNSQTDGGRARWRASALPATRTSARRGPSRCAPAPGAERLTTRRGVPGAATMPGIRPTPSRGATMSDKTKSTKSASPRMGVPLGRHVRKPSMTDAAAGCVTCLTCLAWPGVRRTPGSRRWNESAYWTVYCEHCNGTRYTGDTRQQAVDCWNRANERY